MRATLGEYCLSSGPEVQERLKEIFLQYATEQVRINKKYINMAPFNMPARYKHSHNACGHLGKFSPDFYPVTGHVAYYQALVI